MDRGVRQESSNLITQIPLCDFMVFLVIRCSTLRRHNHLIIPLISVNDGSTNTGVRVDPSDYQYATSSELPQALYERMRYSVS